MASSSESEPDLPHIDDEEAQLGAVADGAHCSTIGGAAADDDAVSGGELAYEGYLSSRSSSSTHNSWRRYYFKLLNLSLYWFASKTETKPRGSIALGRCSARHVHAQDRMGHRQWIFELTSKNFSRVYAFQADTRHEMTRWIALLNACSSNSAKNHGLLGISQQEMAKIDFGSGELWRKKAGVSNRGSQWRQKNSILGISSSASRSLEVIFAEKLHLPNPTCLDVHNIKSLIAVGNSSAKDKGMVQIVSAPDGYDDSFKNARRFIQAEGVTDISWFDNIMLTASTAGDVYLYQFDPEKDVRNISLSATFSHSRWMGEQSFIPGQWLPSNRINSIKINPVEKSSFVSLENQRMHVWNIEHYETPTFSGKASTSPVFSSEWSPHNSCHLMIGGLNKSLKLFDVRSLTKSPDRAVVWRMTNAHDDIVRDISWSPLMKHWIASAGDDGCVLIWDLRMNKTCIRSLHSHTNAVHHVRWSRSQAEVLCSGSIDRTIRHWNLSLSPHYIMNTVHDMKGPISGLEFSSQEPMTTLAVSSSGALAAVRMTSSFSKHFAQHRFAENEVKEREIEALLYGRDIGLAFERIADLAVKYWEQDNYEQTARLLALCSTTMFESCTSRTPKSQTKLIRDLAYYIPPNALLKSSVPEDCTRRIQVLRIRLALRKLLEVGRYNDILSLEDDICTHLQQDENAFSIPTLNKVVEFVLPFEYLRGMRFSLRLAEILRDHGRFNDFVDVATSLLYPTVYHEQPDQPSGFVTEPLLVKKALVTLDRDLRNPKIVIPQLELLYQVHVALEMPDASLQVIDIMEEVHKVLPASVHRLYFNALIQQKNYDKFFILATHLVQLVDGYAFAAVIRSMMDEVGFPRLNRFLDLYSRSEDSNSGDPGRFISGSLTIVNMLHNCVIIPGRLERSLPVYLKKYTHALDKTLRQMPAVEASKNAEQILSLVSRIKDNKRTSNAFFPDELLKFTNMLMQYANKQ